ncbi:MAG TPA: DUF4389 domain-containing protein [Longimicrobium sp.]|nr:DUF4389 domain-containing protein [Longimicrobium sp.]
MHTLATDIGHPSTHPVDVRVQPATGERNRLTTGFRMFLAIPHLLLVGAPLAAVFSWTWGPSDRLEWTGGGVLGAVAAVCALIAWFAILFTGRYPEGLRKLAVFFLQWRVRAVAYTALLRDEYPPFGDGPYPAELVIHVPDETVVPRDRVSVGFRIILAIPHLLAVWVLGIGWALATIIAWFAILVTGRYPDGLYGFAVGVMRWTTRVEAYLLLLHDEYPPFSLD